MTVEPTSFPQMHLYKIMEVVTSDPEETLKVSLPSESLSSRCPCSRPTCFCAVHHPVRECTRFGGSPRASDQRICWQALATHKVLCYVETKYFFAILPTLLDSNRINFSFSSNSSSNIWRLRSPSHCSPNQNICGFLSVTALSLHHLFTWWRSLPYILLWNQFSSHSHFLTYQNAQKDTENVLKDLLVSQCPSHCLVKTKWGSPCRQ